MKIRLRALAVLAAAGLCLGAGGTALAAEGPLPAAARAVGTFEELKAALAAPGSDDIVLTGTIQVTELLPVNGEKTLSAQGGGLTRAAGATGGLLAVQPGASLTLENLQIDGNRAAGAASAALVQVGAPATLTLASGCTLQNSLVQGAGTTGGGVFATGTGATVAVQEGALVQNCSCTGRGGGGLALTQGAQLNMSGGSVSQNSVANYGGGVYLLDAGFSMSGGELTGNSAASGGGVALFGSAVDPVAGRAQLSLLGSARIAGNSAATTGGTEVGYGGGVYQAGGNLVIDSPEAVVEENAAAKEGGGLYLTYYSTSPYPEGILSLKQGTVQRNTALYWGGGISSREGLLRMSGGLVAENRVLTTEETTASGTFYGGGGISAETATGFGGVGQVELTGGTIRQNSAENCYGGGLFCWGSNDTDTPPLLAGTDILQNSAKYGGGIANAGRASSQNDTVLRMTGGRVEENTATVDGGGVYNAEMPYFTRPTADKVQVQFLFEGGSIRQNSAGGLGGGVYNARGRTPANPNDRQTSVGRMAFIMSDAALLYDNTAGTGGDDAWNDNGVMVLRRSYGPNSQGQPFAGWFTDDPDHRYTVGDTALAPDSSLLNRTGEELSSLTGGFAEDSAVEPYGLKAVWDATVPPGPGIDSIWLILGGLILLFTLLAALLCCRRPQRDCSCRK